MHLRSRPVKSVGEDWIGVPALAKELGVDAPGVPKRSMPASCRAYRFGRVIRIKRADVEAFLERSKVKPGELRHLYPPSEKRAAE